MKLDTSWFHLILFLACLASLTFLIATGHENSPMLQQLIGGLFGGVMGGSGAGALPLLTRFLKGPDEPPSASAPVTTPRNQGGYARVAFLVFMACTAGLSMIACSTNPAALAAHPVATACATSSAALKTITIARQAGVLSPADTAVVNDAVSVIAPICSAPDEPSADMVAFNTALTKLTQVAAHYSASQ